MNSLVNPLSLVSEDNPILHTVAVDVTDIGQEIVPILDSMIDLMISSGGCGLAAPQIGIGKRFFIIKEEFDMNAKLYINPEIIKSPKEKTLVINEGCLSKKGFRATKERYDKLTIGYINFKGEYRIDEITPFKSIIFQHELDHLNGICIWDEPTFNHLSKPKTDQII